MWAMLHWRPKLVFDRDAAMRLGRAGGGILLANLAGIINKRIVDGITGTVLGLAQLGHFRLGWRFFDFMVQFSVTPLSAVALSAFSSIQHDRERLTRAYLRLTQFAAIASLPMFFGLGAIADLLVPVVLGDKWSHSIIVMQMLGFVMLGGVVNYFFGSVLIAVGRVNVVVRQSTAQIFGTAVLVLVGAQFGILGVLLAIVTRALMVAAYNISALHKEIGLSLTALFQTLMPPVVACGVMVAVVRFGLQELKGAMPDFVLLGVLIVLGAFAYGATLLAGDFLGLWRGYIKGMLTALGGVIIRRRASPTMAGA
jgi:PST family polysaccharide transporter